MLFYSNKEHFILSVNFFIIIILSKKKIKFHYLFMKREDSQRCK